MTTTAPDPALAAARERVVRLLTDRFADDTLTVEEFEERLDRMHALASAPALEAMARELEAAAATTAAVAQAAPAPGPWGPPAAPYAPYPAPSQAPSQAPPAWDGAAGRRPAQHHPPYPHDPRPDRGAAEEGSVFAVMSTAKRRGAWAVPRRLRAVSVMGEVVLDLREAGLAGDCDIEVFAVMGNVRVILPYGADARVEVDAFMGAADDRTRRRYLAAPGAGPLVRVTGLAIMAEVRVDHG